MAVFTFGRSEKKKLGVSELNLLREDNLSIERKGPIYHKIVIFAITVLVLFTVSTLMIVAGFYVNSSNRLSAVLPEFCCDCKELYKFSGGNKGSEQTRNRRNADKPLKCCAKTPGEYMKIMKKMQEKIKIERFLEGKEKQRSKGVTFTLLHRVPVAGHVLIDALESYVQPTNEKGRLPIIKLLPERSLSLLKQVTCERDRIIIHSKGVYLVYSQLYMKAIRGTNWPEGWKLLVHVVERYNKYLPNGGEEKLLQAVHTLTESLKHKDMSIDFHTSYTSGVFELEKGDELYVRVNSSDVISRNPAWNYIGVVRLSDTNVTTDN